MITVSSTLATQKQADINVNRHDAEHGGECVSITFNARRGACSFYFSVSPAEAVELAALLLKAAK
jgi:hypothetical protein